MVSVEIARFGESIGPSRGVRILHKPVFPGAALDLGFVANRGYATVAPGHGLASAFLSGSTPDIDGSGLLIGATDVINKTFAGSDNSIAIFAQGIVPAATGAQKNIFQWDYQNSANNCIRMLFDADETVLMQVRTASSIVATQVFSALTPGERFKAAMFAKDGQALYSLNGAAGTEDGSFSIPPAPTVLRFGSAANGTAQFLSYLERTTAWKDFDMTQSQLDALTTL